MSGFVTFEEVYKRYHVGDVDITASDGVSFEVNKGEFAVIVGASGAGKTTVLNLLGGMDSCDEGHILVDGRDIANYSQRQLTAYRRFDIGFVFQFYNLVQNLTGKENVELSFRAGSSSGSRSPAHLQKIRSCSSATSRRGRSTITPAKRSSSCCRTPAGKTG